MSQITKSNVEALFEPELLEGIIQGAEKKSVAMSLFRRLPNMSTKMTKMRVLDALPTAYWVDNATNNGRKGLTQMAWANKYIIAEEIAVIVPIKEEILDDVNVDIWGQVKPRIEEAFAKKFDSAVFGGVDKPLNFRADLLSSIKTAGGVITPQQNETLYSQIDRAMAFVEGNDYEPSALVGGLSLKSAFRNMLDTTGQPINGTEIGALKRHFVSNGTWDKTIAKMIVGDFSQAVYAIRQDATFKILTEAIIQDPATGTILYNLAQEDMVALRCVFRIGWEIPNPINAENPTEKTRFPFACIEASASSVVTQTVTFTVVDSLASEIVGAKIVFGGMVGKTDANGQCVFNAVAGNYKYKISATGKNDVKGTTTVASSAVTATITLPDA